jgi:hypothetical protein
MRSRAERVAETLERLAKRMREDGDVIVAEAERIKSRIDDKWHLGPSMAAAEAIGPAAARLSMSEEDLSLLVRVVWNFRD